MGKGFWQICEERGRESLPGTKMAEVEIRKKKKKTRKESHPMATGSAGTRASSSSSR